MDNRSFAAKLKAEREAKGFESQSDLAREVWGEVPNARGYLVARNRDRISCYEAGRSLPNAKHLKQIADALGCAPADLLDQAAKPPANRTPLEFQMTKSAKPGNAFVQINMDMPFSIAAAICERLGEI